MLIRLLLVGTLLASFLAVQAPQTAQSRGAERPKATSGSYLRDSPNQNPIDTLRNYLAGLSNRIAHRVKVEVRNARGGSR